MDKNWWLYILRCGDGTYYTGIAVDVDRRFQAHCTGKGARYTRGRGPLTIVYREQCADHSAALRREYALKQRPREEKQKLIDEYQKNCCGA